MIRVFVVFVVVQSRVQCFFVLDFCLCFMFVCVFVFVVFFVVFVGFPRMRPACVDGPPFLLLALHFPVCVAPAEAAPSTSAAAAAAAVQKN